LTIFIHDALGNVDVPAIWISPNSWIQKGWRQPDAAMLLLLLLLLVLFKLPPVATLSTLPNLSPSLPPCLLRFCPTIPVLDVAASALSLALADADLVRVLLRGGTGSCASEAKLVLRLK